MLKTKEYTVHVQGVVFLDDYYTEDEFTITATDLRDAKTKAITKAKRKYGTILSKGWKAVILDEKNHD